MKEVTISPERMDLGQIDGDKQRDFWFGVTNNTDHTIDFTAWASCGCTTPAIIPTRIEAGQSGKLIAAFNPIGKSGLQEKAVGVNYTVDGKQKSVSATFIARI